MNFATVTTFQGRLKLPDEVNRIFAVSPSDSQLPLDIDDTVAILAFWIRWQHVTYQSLCLNIDEHATDLLLLPPSGSPHHLPPLLRAIAAIDETLLTQEASKTEEKQALYLWGWFLDACRKENFQTHFTFSSQLLDFIACGDDSFLSLPFVLRAHMFYCEGLMGGLAEDTTELRQNALGKLGRWRFDVAWENVLPKWFLDWLNEPSKKYPVGSDITRLMDCIACSEGVPVAYHSMQNIEVRLRFIGWIWECRGDKNLFCPVPTWFVKQGLSPSPFVDKQFPFFMGLSLHARMAYHGEIPPNNEIEYLLSIGRYLESAQFANEEATAHGMPWMWHTLTRIDTHAIPLPSGLRAIMYAREARSKGFYEDTEAGRRTFLASIVMEDRWLKTFADENFLQWCAEPTGKFPPGTDISRLMDCLAELDTCPISRKQLNDDKMRLLFTAWVCMSAVKWGMPSILPTWFLKQCQAPSPRHLLASTVGLSYGMEALCCHSGMPMLPANAEYDDLLFMTQYSERYPDEVSPALTQPIWSKVRAQRRGEFHTMPGYSLDGANLMGATNVVSGLGEDQRAGHNAMVAVGLKHILYDTTSVINYTAPVHSLVNDDYISSELHFALNIAYLPAHDAYILRRNSPKELWRGRYFIVSSPWELPVYPKSFSFAYEALDEIWAPSNFIKQAFANAPIPVTHMPLAVGLSPVKSTLRPELGIHSDEYVFLFIFDYNSAMHRKNPMAAIRAFRKAFPRSVKDVRFIIKSINGHRHPLAQAEITQARDNDTRIIFYDEAFERTKLTALMQTCDCFVSLHRSEGFGRNIAECMLLKKPVIVSAFSGNMDFTLPNNAFLVPGKIVDINKNSFIRGVQNGEWFEADQDAAVSQMRYVYNNRESAAEVAYRGQKFIIHNYSYSVVGNMYYNFLRSRGFCVH